MITTLRVYLILVALANVAGLATLAMTMEQIQADHPRLTEGLIVILYAAGLATVAAVALMWIWRKAGIWLITLAYGVMLGINIHYGAPAAHTMLGPIGLGILYLLIWLNRDRFGLRPR